MFVQTHKKEKLVKEIVLFAVCIGSLLSSLHAAEGLGKRLLVAGWGLPYIAVYDSAGNEEWRIPANGKQCDCWWLGDDRILYSYGGGVCEVQRDTTDPKGFKTVWDQKVLKGGEAHGCQPLPNGDILICENYPKHIEVVEIERGTMKEKLRLKLIDPHFAGSHGSARQVRKTSQGTYLFTLMGGSKDGREYDASGKLLRAFPGLRFSLAQLPDGSYLGAGGDDHSVKGFDADGKETWKIGGKDIPGFQIGFTAAVQQLDDGTILVANWGGHGGSDGPCIGRISADRKSLIGSLKIKPTNRIVCFQVLPEAVKQGTSR
jgi:hypothetical protein